MSYATVPDRRRFALVLAISLLVPMPKPDLMFREVTFHKVDATRAGY